MRISAPWIGLPLESFTEPLSPADPCALTFSIKQNETNPIATTRMSIFMLQEYDFGRVCTTRPDTGNHGSRNHYCGRNRSCAAGGGHLCGDCVLYEQRQLGVREWCGHESRSDRERSSEMQLPR